MKLSAAAAVAAETDTARGLVGTAFTNTLRRGKNSVGIASVVRGAIGQIGPGLCYKVKTKTFFFKYLTLFNINV